MQRGVRWDQAAIRTLICLAVIASAAPALLDAPRAVSDAQAAVGAAGVVLLCLAVAPGPRPARLGDRGPVLIASATVVAACVICLALPLAPVVWIPLLAMATVGLSGLAMARVLALGAVTVLSIAWSSWQATADPLDVTLDAGSALLVLALSLGWVRRREARQLAQAQQRVIEMERARAVTHARQQQVAAELHDVLAHTLSGLIITLQATALSARTERVPGHVLERIDVATALARDGLTEARRAVETLHTETTGPGDVDLARWLDEALERLRTGTSMDVTVHGNVHGLPPLWSELARAVLMEALTNAIRHAAGAPVRITITGPLHPALRVLCVGDRDQLCEQHHHSGGHGLRGLSQRAAQLGAAVVYGPTEDGFVVSLGSAPRQGAP